MSAKKRVRTKRSNPQSPKTAKPHELAFIAEQPCANCACEWFRPTIDTTSDEIKHGVACANPWCSPIAQFRAVIEKLKADRLALAKLAAVEPQFFNPLEVFAAQELRDRVLAASARPPAKADPRDEAG